ncbi:tetratricopeptide repeat protein [Robertmurraya massiliosenegalensis]|uniref:tetratricopeptide repeat protein n=1 Tax=Robertmurraya massiliosenegalensis TaxID=1287657 RepID=UPI0002E03789|nr:tetratricopeptide repeat protein [Robertmurraya massiliosenegalensis]
MNSKLLKAIKLRENGFYEQCYQEMTELAKNFPDDPEILYQCAWSCDSLGKEAEAIPYYESAIKLGLSGKELEGAYLGLGSTFRTLGNYVQSKAVLEVGMNLFPQNQALKVFYTMTLYNLNEHDKAMETLLSCLMENTANEDILAYKNAIQFYANKLDQIWVGE